MKAEPPKEMIATRRRLANALNAEFWRVAKAEDVEMQELVPEVAELVGLTPRQVYNHRSGKWPFDSHLVPIFCKRFGSLALLRALEKECRDVTTVEVPELFDLGRKVTQTLRDDMEFYLQLLKDFEDGAIQPNELVRLRELSEQCHRGQVEFLEIAAADCERRYEARKGSLGRVSK